MPAKQPTGMFFLDPRVYRKGHLIARIKPPLGIFNNGSEMEHKLIFSDGMDYSIIKRWIFQRENLAKQVLKSQF